MTRPKHIEELFQELEELGAPHPEDVPLHVYEMALLTAFRVGLRRGAAMCSDRADFLRRANQKKAATEFDMLARDIDAKADTFRSKG